MSEKSSDSPRPVNDYKEIVKACRLTDIKTYVVHGKLTEGQEDMPPELSVTARGESTFVEARCSLRLQTAEAELGIDRAAHFELEEPMDLSEEALRMFIEKVGLLTVFPYLREGITTLAATLGIAAPIIQPVMPGGIRLGKPVPIKDKDE